MHSAYRTDRTNIGGTAAALAAQDMDKSLLPEQFAGPSESDDLIVSADLDLTIDDDPATLDTIAPLTDRLARKEVELGKQVSAFERAPDHCRIRTEFLKKEAQLLFDDGR